VKELSPQKRIIFWIIFIIIFTVVPLAIVEGGGRAYIYFKYGVPGKTYGLWRYDEILGAQHRENAYNTNSETNNYGFRNKENVIDAKSDGALRIISYGGSTTYCYNLLNEEAWPLQLQKILREEHNDKDQVLNGGAIVWSIGHAYARSKKDIPLLTPDYVIIYSGINEQTNADYLAMQDKRLEDLIRQGKYGEFATNLDQNRWEKRNLFIIRILDYLIKPLINNIINQNSKNNEKLKETRKRPIPVILENYLNVLEDFILFIKNNGGIPIFFVQTHGRIKERSVYLTSYSRSGATLAKELGLFRVSFNFSLFLLF